MKFDLQEMLTINDFFEWVNKTLNDEEKYIIGDGFIEEKETGIITRLDVGYGIEMLKFLQIQYNKEYYKQ